MKKILFTLIGLLFIFTNLNAQTSNYYRIADKIHLEGDVVWDYLTIDAVSNRLYVSNSNQVQVIDTKINKKIGTISNTKGVHGIAIASNLNKGYTSNGTDTTVTVFNHTTLQTLKKIKVTGKKPDAIMFDIYSQKVFCFNASGSNATVINAITDSVIATIPLNGKPETGVSDNNGFIYVNIADSNIIRVINANTHQIIKRWTLGNGTTPKGMAIDIVNHRLFSTCSNNMMKVINYDDGSIVASITIGSSVDGVAYDDGYNRILCSSGDGAMTIIQMINSNIYTVLENTITQSGAATVAVNPITHHFYVLCGEYEPASKPSIKNPRLKISPKQSSFTVLDFAPL